MASKSLNNRPDYVAKLPKTDHDISQNFGFTASTGHILPVYQQFMNVGETVYLSPSMFGRSNPLLNAAMADVDFYIDTFFVPMQMLFNAWDSLRWQTNDPISSVWVNRFTSQLGFPSFDLKKSVWPIDSGEIFMSKQSFISACIQATGFSPAGLVYNADFFDGHARECLRLFNHLHMPLGNIFQGLDGSYFSQDYEVRALFPYLLAYNCICQNFYRLDDWEQKNVMSYNLDKTFLDNASSPTNAFMPFACQLYYRPWHMDYFTSLKNNPLSSYVNMVGGINVDPASILPGLLNYLQPGVVPSGVHQAASGNPVNTPISDNTFVYNTQTGSSGVPATVGLRTSTASLRSIFAYEKLLRVFGRTAKDYDSQVLAHFGFKVPHDVKHQISYLGTSKAILHIGEVVSTSDTRSDAGGAALGSIAGKGYVTLQGKRIKFTAPVDGIVMMLFSAVPRRLYDATIDKVNLMSSMSDLYIPEYDKLGMQPIYRFERRDLDFNATTVTERIGWQYRYEQFKRKPNVCTLAFRNPVAYQSQPYRPVNMYSSWFVTSGDGNYESLPALAVYHYCPPTALNNLMVVPYVTTWSDSYLASPWLVFQQDPFICDLQVDGKLISTMSRFGEPELD